MTHGEGSLEGAETTGSCFQSGQFLARGGRKELI